MRQIYSKFQLKFMYHISHTPYEVYLLIKDKKFNIEHIMDELNSWFIHELPKLIEYPEDGSFDTLKFLRKQLTAGFKQLNKHTYNIRAKSLGHKLIQFSTYKEKQDIEFQMRTNTTQWVDTPSSLFRISHTLFDNYNVIAFSFNPTIRYEHISKILDMFLKQYIEKNMFDAEFFSKLLAYDLPHFIDDRFDTFVKSNKDVQKDVDFVTIQNNKPIIHEGKRNNIMGWLFGMIDKFNHVYIEMYQNTLKDKNIGEFKKLFDTSLLNDKRIISNILIAGMKPIIGIINRTTYLQGISKKPFSIHYLMTESTENIHKLYDSNIMPHMNAMDELRDMIFTIADKDLIDNYYNTMADLLILYDFLTDNAVEEKDLTDSMRSMVEFENDEDKIKFIYELELEIFQIQEHIDNHLNTDIKGTNYYFELITK